MAATKRDSGGHSGVGDKGAIAGAGAGKKHLSLCQNEDALLRNPVRRVLADILLFSRTFLVVFYRMYYCVSLCSDWP